MKKRISSIVTILILIFALTISVSADYINTFQFIQNLSFVTQTNYSVDSSTVFKPVIFSDDENYRVFFNANDANGYPVTYSYGFMCYGMTLNRAPSATQIDINIPLNLHITKGATIKIPFIFATNRDFSFSTNFAGSFVRIGDKNHILSTSTNTDINSIGYINEVYTNTFTLKKLNGSTVSNEWSKSKYFYFNLFNNTDIDTYVSSITLRLKLPINEYNEQIIFPFIYEGDELIQYIPPNPYNIPILQDINSTLDLIISKLVSGDSSVADLLDTVISLIESLDSNIGSIDLNIVQIVNQLNYLSSINSYNENINTNLIYIRRMLSDLTENTQNLPSQVFDQIINDNKDYIDIQKETTVNNYNNANEEKNDIYTSSSSGLTSSGGTYDLVADLVADAGSDQGFNGIFGLIFGDSNISGIILSVIALGTISYILYGKRG